MEYTITLTLYADDRAHEPDLLVEQNTQLTITDLTEHTVSGRVVGIRIRASRDDRQSA